MFSFILKKLYVTCKVSEHTETGGQVRQMLSHFNVFRDQISDQPSRGCSAGIHAGSGRCKSWLVITGNKGTGVLAG